MKSPKQFDEITASIRGKMLSFPLTDFDAEDRFDRVSFVNRLDWLGQYSPGALFPAGGAGEYFSLRADEYTAVVRETVEWSNGRIPVIAAAGMGTHAAVAHAREARDLGAGAILLLPPYMTETSQAGLLAHITAVCQSIDIGVIVYNRGNCKLRPESVVRLAEACPNFIALKDGIGNLEWLLEMRALLGERLLFINGMPTAEVYAAAYSAIDVTTYSSAIFNFVPRTACEFHQAIKRGDAIKRDAILRDFLVPYLKLRNRQPGYAVSIVKAGVDIIGRGAGPVRAPLSELTSEERNELDALIRKLGPQELRTTVERISA
jgi:5-dehydro-4-deoxyglucarate dehydratase